MYKVVVVKETEDQKIILTRNELEEMLNKAYNDGVKDGRLNPYINPPLSPLNPWDPIYKITCNNIDTNNKPCCGKCEGDK